MGNGWVMNGCSDLSLLCMFTAQWYSIQLPCRVSGFDTTGEHFPQRSFPCPSPHDQLNHHINGHASIMWFVMLLYASVWCLSLLLSLPFLCLRRLHKLDVFPLLSPTSLHRTHSQTFRSSASYSLKNSQTALHFFRPMTASDVFINKWIPMWLWVWLFSLLPPYLIKKTYANYCNFFRIMVYFLSARWRFFQSPLYFLV